VCSEVAFADDQTPRDDPPAQSDASKPATANKRRKSDEHVSFKSLPHDVLHDQAFLWLRPFRLHSSDLPWTGAFLGTTAGLMFIDNNVAQGLVANPPGHGYNFSRTVTKLGTPLYGSAIMGTVYLVGLASKSQHAQATGILGIRAVADSMIIVESLKAATQRPRPTLPGGVIPNHNADGEFFAGGNSFPSGHAAGSFALATVVAQRNRNRPWISVASYGLAGLVSVPRITERRHFPSDVFVGAVLGHLVGRHVAHSAEPQSPSVWNHLQIEPYPTRGGSSGISVTWNFQ
jgi:membrane-associated phospholipid phosphatase